MNMLELERNLNALSKKSTFPQYALVGIIAAIINVWASVPSFTDEKAVKTMEHFLQTGILNFSL